MCDSNIDVIISSEYVDEILRHERAEWLTNSSVDSCLTKIHFRPLAMRVVIS